MNQPIFLPTGAWCLWDSAQQLPLYLGKPWRDIFSELSKNIGLKEATAEMLAALDAPSRWGDVLREVEKDKGKIAATALKRLTRNGPPVRVCASVIRAELTRDRDQERREALEAQRGQNISIAKRKKKQAAASKEVTVVADRKSRKEIEPTVEQIANPEWEWDSLANIARACGDRDRDSIRYRFTSDASKWMHYETAPADEIEGKWDKRAKFVYRIRPGYPIHALNDEQQQQLREELGETVEEVDEVEHQAIKDDAPTREESVKVDARIATLETALITTREKVTDLEASLEDAKTYCDERDEQIESLEAALSAAREKIVDLETCHNLARETRETWKQRAENAEAIQSETSKRVESLEAELASARKLADARGDVVGALDKFMSQISEVFTKHTGTPAEQIDPGDLLDLFDDTLGKAGRIQRLVDDLVDANRRAAEAEAEVTKIRHLVDEHTLLDSEELSQEDLLELLAGALAEMSDENMHGDAPIIRIKNLEQQLAYQKKQEKGYQDAIGDLQMQVFQRGEELKELERRCTEAEHDLDIEAGHLDKIRRLIETHTVFSADELSFNDVLSVLAGALGEMSGVLSEDGRLAVLESRVTQMTKENQRLLTRSLELKSVTPEGVDKAFDTLKGALALEAQPAPFRIEELAQLAVNRIVQIETQCRMRDIQQTFERAGEMILKAEQVNAAFEVERFEAILSQGFDLVRDLYRAGVHLPVELSAWLWEAQETLRDVVEGAA